MPSTVVGMTRHAPQDHPAHAAEVLRDPVCGMLVEIATARYRAEAWGRIFYFCCAGCKDAFEQDPTRYAAVPHER